MKTSSGSTLLVYGYDLGGTEEWKVHEADEDDGGLLLDWLSADDLENGYFADAAMEELLSTAGFAGGDPLTWESESATRLGVEVTEYRCESHPLGGYVLAARVVAATPEQRENPANAPAAAPEEERNLRRALAVLGLTPHQTRAEWLLRTPV